MARAGRFRIAAMQALWSQLEFAPVPATRRMLARIRELLPGIGADELYEPTEIVRSIVKFPVEEAPGGDVGMLVGAALRADLAELALRLSRKAPVPEGPGTLGLAEAASAARVCVRTLRRWRERGLMLHWIGRPDGPSRVGVRAEDLKAFTDAHPALCAGAAGFRRIGAEVRDLIVQEGAPRLASGEPMARVARQIAERHGCSTGAVRAMLMGAAASKGLPRHPATGARAGAARPIEGRAVRRERAQRMWEAWVAGTAVPELAARWRVSERAAAHALRAERVCRLASVRERLLGDAAGIPAHAPSPAEWKAASHGLAVGASGAWGASAAPPSAADPADPPGGTPLVAHAIVMRALLARAAACPLRPSASELDRAETDIRWAVRLLLTLTRASKPALERRIRVWLAGLDRATAQAYQAQMPALAARAVLEACRTDAAGLRRGRVRIERLASAELDLALARVGASGIAGAVDPVSESGKAGGGVGDALASAAPWAALAPLHDGCAEAPAATEVPRKAAPRSASEMLAWREGWDGSPPSTLDEIAAAAERPRWVVARSIDRARAACARR